MIFDGRQNFAGYWIKRYPEVWFEIGELAHYAKIHAADEFSSGKSESVIMLTTGQALVLKQ